jgi:hypothetical protein
MNHRLPFGRRYANPRQIFFALAVLLLAEPALSAKAPANSPSLAVPVGILDLMRASIEIPADGIWAAQGALQTTALSLRAAAKAKDLPKFSTAADHLSEICQNCHTKYRPEAPSDGLARYPFYPKRELAK